MMAEFKLSKKRNGDVKKVRNSEKVVESMLKPYQRYGRIVGCRIQRK